MSEYKYLDENGLIYYHSKIKNFLNNKVDKVSGKGLSTNDYTTTEKNKLAGIAEGATANTGTVTSVSVKLNNQTKGTVTTSGNINLGTVIVPDDNPFLYKGTIATSGGTISSLPAPSNSNAGNFYVHYGNEMMVTYTKDGTTIMIYLQDRDAVYSNGADWFAIPSNSLATSSRARFDELSG